MLFLSSLFLPALILLSESCLIVQNQTQTVGAHQREKPVVSSRQRGMKPQRRDAGARNSEQTSNHPQSKPSSARSAVGSVHQEPDSTATNKHARTDHQPSQKILVCEGSAIIIIIIAVTITLQIPHAVDAASRSTFWWSWPRRSAEHTECPRSRLARQTLRHQRPIISASHPQAQTAAAGSRSSPKRRAQTGTGSEAASSGHRRSAEKMKNEKKVIRTSRVNDEIWCLINNSTALVGWRICSHHSSQFSCLLHLQWHREDICATLGYTE